MFNCCPRFNVNTLPSEMIKRVIFQVTLEVKMFHQWSSKYTSANGPIICGHTPPCHVNKIMFDVNISKSHLDIFMLHIDNLSFILHVRGRCMPPYDDIKLSTKITCGLFFQETQMVDIILCEYTRGYIISYILFKIQEPSKIYVCVFNPFLPSFYF